MAGLAFLFMKMWRPLAILSTVSILLPAFDIYLLKRANIDVNAVHAITLGSLIVMAGLLWLRIAG
jgi:hypothetical protein